MCVQDLFTIHFDPEGPSSGNTYIKITVNSYGFKTWFE